MEWLMMIPHPPERRVVRPGFNLPGDLWRANWAMVGRKAFTLKIWSDARQLATFGGDLLPVPDKPF